MVPHFALLWLKSYRRFYDKHLSAIYGAYGKKLILMQLGFYSQPKNFCASQVCCWKAVPIPSLFPKPVAKWAYYLSWQNQCCKRGTVALAGALIRCVSWWGLRLGFGSLFSGNCSLFLAVGLGSLSRHLITGLNIREIKLTCEVSSRQISAPTKGYYFLGPVNIILIHKGLFSIHGVPSARLDVVKGKCPIWPRADDKLTERVSHKRERARPCLINCKITQMLKNNCIVTLWLISMTMASYNKPTIIIIYLKIFQGSRVLHSLGFML